MVTADELPAGAAGLKIESRLNGQTMQSANTADMMWPVAKTIATSSEFLTLQPGDMIGMGTPPGVGHARKPPVFMEHGDIIEVEIERIGLVRQANWQKVGGASPLERRSNRTTFLREPCVGSREGAGEASVAAWMGRAIEHRKSDGPGCRGFQIGRRQYRRRRFGEMSASPAVSENPCTFARLLLGPWEVFKLPRLS